MQGMLTPAQKKLPDALKKKILMAKGKKKKPGEKSPISNGEGIMMLEIIRTSINEVKHIYTEHKNVVIGTVIVLIIAFIL